MLSKIICIATTVSAYTKCWWGYDNDADWIEDYSDGSITEWNTTRWKLDDKGYNWGGSGAFYSYDGYR